MTPEEFDEYMRKLETAQQGGAPEPLAPAVPREKRAPKDDVELIGMMGDLRERRAEEAARQYGFQVAPTEPIEPGMRERAQLEALDELEEAVAVRARAGDVTSPVNADLFLSRYAGQGQVYNPETGELEPLDITSPSELFRSALGRRMIAEGSDVREAARRVRMGETTREEAGLPEGLPIDFDAPEGGTGVYESYIMPPLKALGFTEAAASEAVFGRFPVSDVMFTGAMLASGGKAGKYLDRQKLKEQFPDRELLFYSVDAEGNPLRPQDPAYRVASAIDAAKEATGLADAEALVEEFKDSEYVDAARALSRRIEDAAMASQVPFGNVLSGVSQVGEAYAAITGDKEGIIPSVGETARELIRTPRLIGTGGVMPTPFQATERMLPTGEAIGGALDHDDFIVRVIDASAKGRGLGDETVAVTDFREDKERLYGSDETVLGVHPAYASGMLSGVIIPTGPGLKIVGGLTGEVVRRGVDLLTSSATVRSLAARGAARQVLGQAVEAADAPSVKSIAASRVVNPVATALEMQAVAAEALAAGQKTIKATDLAARFGGNATAARLLDQAAKATPGAAGVVENIDARVLQEVARPYVMAGDAARVLADMPGMALDKARRVVSEMVDPAKRAAVESMTKGEMERLLRGMLQTTGHAPNTKTPFLNSMYAMASRIQDDILRGAPVGEIVTRSIKGMGANGALFQKHLLRALVEEGRRAGKDVESLILKAARGKMSAGKLWTMAEALGDGRGSWAVARAYRDTMTDAAKDAVMQALPEDYRFLSRTLMIAEDKWKDAHKALIDLMDSTYTITGTRGTGSVVTPNAGVEMSELVSRVVQEIGPGVLQGGEGYRVAKSMLRKLQAGEAMSANELALFTTSMQESLARDVPGIIQAVTEGAQTALAQGGMAARNQLYIDAATGLGIGQSARGGRRALMALKESADIVVEASKGNSAASMLIADPDKFVGKNITRAASWLSERVLKDAGAFEYNPGTSVIAESYAREAQAAVATSGDRVKDRLAQLAAEKVTGDAAFTVVAKEQMEEAADMAVARFRRDLSQAIEQLDPTDPDAFEKVLAEAERTARYMMSNVTAVAGAESFKRGEGIIEAALKQSGFRGGLKALRRLPVDEAVQKLEDAVVLAQKTQYNAESWVNLIKTTIPGKTTQEMVLTGKDAVPVSEEIIGRIPGLRAALGDQAEAAVTLDVAVRAITRTSGQVDLDGMLVPNITNLRRVMEVLEAANGKRVYEHSLRYSDIASLGQSLKDEAQDAWVVGTMSWLVHQRAGLDSARVMGRLFDNHPELVLDLMPGTVNGAKAVQEVALQQVLSDMVRLEEAVTGQPANYNAYMKAMEKAYDRLNGTIQGGSMTDLERTVYNLARYMETMDLSLEPGNRVALATKLFRASQAYQGAVPDAGSLVQATVADVLGAMPSTMKGLEASEQMALKKHVTDLMARYEVGGPFEAHLAALAEPMGVSIGRGQFKDFITDAMVNGVTLGVDTSLIAPAYRALESLWQRTGHMLGSGQFAAGIDTTVLLSEIRTTAGQSYSMPMSNAVKRLKDAVDSGRLQSNLDALSVKARKAAGEAGQFEHPVATAIGQVVQSVNRTMNSTLLAGGGVPGLSVMPHPIYHFRNAASVPELLIATIGAEMAVKAGRALPVGAKSAARNAQSFTFRKGIAKAILPASSESEVVIRSPLYGNITAGELDEMMDVANIKFSRASIEAYESIGQQMAEAAKMNLRTVFKQSGTPATSRTQFLRAFDPSGMNEWMKVAEDTDGITRRATFAAALIDGRSIEDAALLARESLLDYGKVAASGFGPERWISRYLLFWSFRRQSLVTTVNALADGTDGVFSRADIMGRWIRLKQDQKKGRSPEEYLFGEDYKKLRGFDEDVDDYGYNMGMPSVVGEGYGDLIMYMSIPGEFVTDLGEGRPGEAFEDSVQLMLEALESENFQPVVTFLSKAAQEAGRLDEPGPVVPDVVVGQALAWQNATGMNSFNMMAKTFGWVAELDEEGVPRVTPGRPTLRRGAGRPYQLRFRTKADALHYDAIRLLQTMGGSARTPDEYFRIAATIEGFVPEGYEARYRAYAGTLAYIMGTETPTRKTSKAEERAKLQKQVERKVQRAAQR